MDADIETIGALRAMLMPARWHGLRKGEVNRVMEQLVYPKVFKISPKWYLVKIIELMNLKDDLSSFLIDKHPSENDSEVRGFLLDIALEIERAFPNFARSGQPVKISGNWITDNGECSLCYFKEGEVLPHVDEKVVVWQKKSDVATSPEHVLLEEFRTYYTYRTMRGKILYKQPHEFATYSLCRLMDREFNPYELEVETLLLAMSEERKHPLTKKIEGITKQDWTEDDENWEWYRGLLSAMHNGMKNLQA